MPDKIGLVSSPFSRINLPVIELGFFTYRQLTILSSCTKVILFEVYNPRMRSTHTVYAHALFSQIPAFQDLQLLGSVFSNNMSDTVTEAEESERNDTESNISKRCASQRMKVSTHNQVGPSCCGRGGGRLLDLFRRPVFNKGATQSMRQRLISWIEW